MLSTYQPILLHTNMRSQTHFFAQNLVTTGKCIHLAVDPLMICSELTTNLSLDHFHAASPGCVHVNFVSVCLNARVITVAWITMSVLQAFCVWLSNGCNYILLIIMKVTIIINNLKRVWFSFNGGGIYMSRLFWCELISFGGYQH